MQCPNPAWSASATGAPSSVCVKMCSVLPWTTQAVSRGSAVRRRLTGAGQREVCSGLRRINWLVMTVCTGSFRWFSVVYFRRTVPRSGRVIEGRASMTSTTARSVSSGRTGLSQRTSSNPGEPGLWVRRPNHSISVLYLGRMTCLALTDGSV